MFMIVFVVNLTVGAEIAIASGIGVSWMLTLAKQPAKPVPVMILSFSGGGTQSEGLRRGSESSSSEVASKAKVVLEDCGAGMASRQSGLDDMIVVLPFRSSLTFAHSSVLKVRTPGFHAEPFVVPHDHSEICAI